MKFSVPTVLFVASLALSIATAPLTAEVVPAPGAPWLIAAPFAAEPIDVSFGSTAQPVKTSDHWPCQGSRKGNCRNKAWTVTADALFLQRARPGALVLMENPFDAAENLDSQDFEFPFRAGWDVSLARQLNHGNRIELRYYEVDGWNDAASTVTDAGSPLRINTTPPLTLVTGRTIDATYGSKLHNVEVNWLGNYDDGCSVIAGFRYVELDELFHADLIDSITPSPTVRYDTATRNRLYGGQLGLKRVFGKIGGRFNVTVAGKAGIYGNAAAHGSVVNTGVVGLPAAGNALRTAFLADFAATLSYRLNAHFAIRGGYQLTWIDGVAAAPDQLPGTNFITQSGIDSSGDVFYHGVFSGLECAR